MITHDQAQQHVCNLKNAYDNRRKASQAKRHYQRKHGVRMYVYRCRYCDQYHLSTVKGSNVDVKRTKQEIADLFNEALEQIESGSKFKGMTYEDGIVAVLRWLEDETEPSPMGNDE